MFSWKAFKGKATKIVLSYECMPLHMDWQCCLRVAIANSVRQLKAASTVQGVNKIGWFVNKTSVVFFFFFSNAREHLTYGTFYTKMGLLDFIL